MELNKKKYPSLKKESKNSLTTATMTPEIQILTFRLNQIKNHNTLLFSRINISAKASKLIPRNSFCMETRLSTYKLHKRFCLALLAHKKLMIVT